MNSNYRPTSPNYTPSARINETLNPYCNGVDFTTPIVCRKRIYGEEYRTTLSLDVEPNPKNLRLDQIIYESSINQKQQNQEENLSHQIYNKIITRNKIMWPTPTKRIYEKKHIDYNLIPSICHKCLSINCKKNGPDSDRDPLSDLLDTFMSV